MTITLSNRNLRMQYQYENFVKENKEYIFFAGEDLKRSRWVEKYRSLGGDTSSSELLPFALSLIHKDFWFDRDFEIPNGQQPVAFRNPYQWRADHNPFCKWWDLLGTKNTLCGSGFQVEADHVWPKSLGGLKASGNIQPLCSLHNKMKGNSIVFFDWQTWPIWLPTLLQQMCAEYSE